MHLASWLCDEPSIIRTNKSKQSREINLNNCSKKLKRTFKPAAHGFKQCHRLLLVDVQINSCHRAQTKMISLQLGSIFTFSKGNIEFESKVDVKNMSWRWTCRQDHDGQILLVWWQLLIFLLMLTSRNLLRTCKPLLSTIEGSYPLQFS